MDDSVQSMCQETRQLDFPASSQSHKSKAFANRRPSPILNPDIRVASGSNLLLGTLISGFLLPDIRVDVSSFRPNFDLILSGFQASSLKAGGGHVANVIVVAKVVMVWVQIRKL